MKKITMFAAVAVLALSFASCKKTYVCSCSDNATATYAGDKLDYTLPKQKKKDAEATCKSYQTSGLWDACSLK